MELLRRRKVLERTSGGEIDPRMELSRKSFQKQYNYGKEEPRDRNIYEQPSLIEVCSDSDWAADRENRQSVSCGIISLNGNMIHFQSKRQRNISLSSCEAETVTSTGILSGAIFLRELLKRILGIEPKLRLFSDSSSSRQLIARKGLGRARHMDVNLLWVQKVRGLEIKAIKGTENPADLGTKALTKEEIRKYVLILGYEVEEGSEEIQPKAMNGKPISSKMVKRIARIVTMVLMCDVGECKMEETNPERNTHYIMILVGVVFRAFVCMFIAAAFRFKRKLRMPKPKSAMVKSDDVVEEEKKADGGEEVAEESGGTSASDG